MLKDYDQLLETFISIKSKPCKLWAFITTKEVELNVNISSYLKILNIFNKIFRYLIKNISVSLHLRLTSKILNQNLVSHKSEGKAMQ